MFDISLTNESDYRHRLFHFLYCTALEAVCASAQQDGTIRSKIAKLVSRGIQSSQNTTAACLGL